jgi:CPA2 family monovalent cation:H+ antiporter-2
VCLAQIGEFSFVLAAAGRGLIGEEVFGLVVSVTIVSMFVTPTLVAYAVPIAERIVGVFVGMRLIKPDRSINDAIDESISGHAVIVGFGPAGRGVGKVLRKADIMGVVLDLNPGNVRHADEFNFVGQVGDGTQPDVLEHAGVARARLVVVAVPDPSAARAAVSAARALNESVTILARARYHRHIEDLTRAGADIVVDEERVVGTELSFCLQSNLEPGELGKSVMETQF